MNEIIDGLTSQGGILLMLIVTFGTAAGTLIAHSILREFDQRTRRNAAKAVPRPPA